MTRPNGGWQYPREDYPGTAGSIPPGGTADQVLAKIDGADFNTYWRTIVGGGGGGGETFSYWDPDKPPIIPNAADDEAEGLAGATPPGWTAFNLAASSTFLYDGKGRIDLFVPGGSGDVLRFFYKGGITGSYTATVKMASLMAGAFNSTGLCIRDPSSGKMLSLGLQHRGGSVVWIFTWWNSSTSWAGETLGPAVDMNDDMYFQLSWDGTTVTARYARNGTDFQVWTTSTWFTGGTPTQVGLQANSQSGGNAHGYFYFFRLKAATTDQIGGMRLVGGTSTGSLAVYDEGVSVGTGVTGLNFIGGAVVAGAPVSGVIPITISGGSIDVKDEGTTVATGVSALNFIGANVTVGAAVAGVVPITVSGSSGGGGGGGALPSIDLINFWTSSGVKATASSSYSQLGPEGAWLPGEGNGWITNATSTGWVKIEFPSAVTMKSYAINPWYADTFPTRSPKTWTLEGSNDDVTYTVLDTQTNFTAWTRYQRVAFTTSNTTAYKFYKLNVTLNGGDSYMGVGGIYLYGDPGGTGSALPAWVTNHPDNPPTSANAMDDEFTGASLDSKWTLRDLSTINASVTKSYNNGGWLSYSCPSSIQTRIYALTQPAPAGNWRVQSKMAFDSATWNYFGLYLIARRGSVSKSSMAGPLYHSSYGAITTYATRVNEPSTLAIDQDLYDIRSDTFYLELEYDGTNLTWRISKTGMKYTRFWGEAATTFLGGAPEEVGINFHFYGGSSDTNHIMTGSVDWFRRVA